MSEIDHNQRYDSVYKQLVRTKCFDALVAAGFSRFRKEGVDWPLHDGFHCWVGLNTALLADSVEISPFVGLHVVSIEKLWTKLKVGKYQGKYSRGVATYARHIGELAPDERVFRFTNSTDADREASRLAQVYSTVGLNYARSIASYEQLLPLLQDRIEMLGAFPERVACCLYLMGRRDDAQLFVKSFVIDHPEYFKGFAEPFLNLAQRQPTQ